MRIQVDRPARVTCAGDGRWGWSCWCCPMPLRLVTSLADSWAQAMDDADAHVRHNHPAAEIPVRGWAA